MSRYKLIFLENRKSLIFIIMHTPKKNNARHFDYAFNFFTCNQMFLYLKRIHFYPKLAICKQYLKQNDVCSTQTRCAGHPIAASFLIQYCPIWIKTKTPSKMIVTVLICLLCIYIVLHWEIVSFRNRSWVMHFKSIAWLELHWNETLHAKQISQLKFTFYIYNIFI